MYLLDSICKNVGAPYTTCFGINLYRTFADAFTQVPESVRRKLVELYGTWKTSATGGMLFPAEPMRKIASFLERISEVNPRGTPNPGTPTLGTPIPATPPLGSTPVPAGLTQPQLVEKCTHVINMTSDRLQHIPNDADAKERLPVLRQLLAVLQSQAVPVAYLSKIESQLASSLAHEEKKLAEYEENERLRQQQQQQQQPPPNLLASLQAAGLLAGGLHGGLPAGLPGMPPAMPGMPLPGMPPMPIPGMPMPLPGMPFPAFPNAAPQTPDINSLLASGASSLLSSLESNDVELSTSSLLKPRPNLVFNLYGKMPKVCNICGRRFRDNQDHARMQHMDWHFRINKKMRQDEGRAQNRRWYLAEHLWVAGEQKEEKEEKVVAVDMDAVRKQWILAPSSASKKKQLCPICTGGFNTELSDEAEDWVWTDAVQVGDKVFHATCYAESGKLAQTMVRKRKGEEREGRGKREKVELDY